MASKFKHGDKVAAGGVVGKVSSVRSASGKYYCKVKFDNPRLIPPEMEYEEVFLDFLNNESVCPICNTRWHVVRFNNNVWKDCLKCNKKSEDIEIEVKKAKSNKKEEGNNNENLLKEFEKMLDDDDDFGFWLGV